MLGKFLHGQVQMQTRNLFVIANLLVKVLHHNTLIIPDAGDSSCISTAIHLLKCNYGH